MDTQKARGPARDTRTKRLRRDGAALGRRRRGDDGVQEGRRGAAALGEPGRQGRPVGVRAAAPEREPAAPEHDGARVRRARDHRPRRARGRSRRGVAPLAARTRAGRRGRARGPSGHTFCYVRQEDDTGIPTRQQQRRSYAAEIAGASRNAATTRASGTRTRGPTRTSSKRSTARRSRSRNGARRTSAGRRASRPSRCC